MLHADAKVHPAIERCLKHLHILGTDDKIRQIVYMYMETLAREVSMEKQAENTETRSDFENNEKH
ncbi:hypothetical protein [Peribacillus glennii]|uniref:Uncharacterized protein n=1 Tax=Peribacillus glennii TaxID=2303991 RepID=A0A372L9X2_9BACI|nr:hypothetical protein [Peribacillus glennii]RFU62061.1 hypothetical protein D0466_15880 [Peribacillus glennii]